MVHTSYLYLLCMQRIKQNNFKKKIRKYEIFMFSEKNIKKTYSNEIPRLWVSLSQLLNSMTNRMVPTPYLYLSCVWRKQQNNFKKIPISLIFFEIVLSNSLHTRNRQMGVGTMQFVIECSTW